MFPDYSSVFIDAYRFVEWAAPVIAVAIGMALFGLVVWIIKQVSD